MSKRLASWRVVVAGLVARRLKRQTRRTHMEQERFETVAAGAEAALLDRFDINDRWNESEGSRIVEGFLELQASDYVNDTKYTALVWLES